ncbi:MAG: amino acid ABC transporter permease [Armatimonadota bacterium]|nr:amino acid ABC transporter permease [Armatimonadota bacterium]MDR5697804.1 amino acid ABC transporter permease [Armatimonadota bacterium]
MSQPHTAAPGTGRVFPLPLHRFPWWVLVLAISGGLVAARIAGSEIYLQTLRFLGSGIVVTLYLTVASYGLALVIGLVAGLMRVSGSPWLRTPAILYIEVVRGVPLLVLLLYIAFVLTPWLADATQMRFWRDNVVRAVLGLGIGYGAYLAEVYRAGIEAIPRGQVEAALSLGMSNGQAMRYVVLPQAIRIILPPLGNDFVALLKDSSLASVISVTELTYSGNLNVARTFRSFETYNMVALLYLMMTLAGSAGVRLLERATGRGR